MSQHTGEHMDECMVCGDGGVLAMCTYCQNTVHMACAGSQPVNIDLDEWYCSACNTQFGDQVELVMAAAIVARRSAVAAVARVWWAPAKHNVVNWTNRRPAYQVASVTATMTWRKGILW